MRQLFTSSFKILNSSRCMFYSSWKALRLNHVAVAVKDLDSATKFYREVLGAKVSEPVPQPEHGVYTVFVELQNTKIELLYPLGEASPIKKFMEKNKDGGIHHVCMDVDNIQNAIADLKSRNIRLLSDGPKTGAHGYPVVFMHPKDAQGILVELEQPDEEWKRTHAKKN